MSRERLPTTRKSVTHRAVIRGAEGPCELFLTLGFYEDGRPGEVFLCMDRSGCTIDGFADCWATAFSLCLQSGIPLDTLVQKFAFQDFEPRGFTDNPELKTAHSVVDYVTRWIEAYCKPKETDELVKTNAG